MLPALLTAFLLTALVECGMAWLIFHQKRHVLVTLLANVLTNPLLNLIVFTFSLYGSAVIYALEGAVVLFEWLLFARLLPLGWKKSLCLSLALNACSYLIGLLIT